MTLSIERLPHPIIEYIFSYLSPYRDLKQCLLVNKTWYDLVHGTIHKIRRDFHNAVTARNVCWEHTHVENCPTISRRYSHSSCVCIDSMFVFGGCTTACTTFNDLWRLDLGSRSWIRPLATGTYPPPKACASMVCYRDNLILFGGWTHTSPYPLHQAWHIFNHIHIYNTNTNRWNQVVPFNSCPGMAGHTATMVGDKMVVFGGLHCQSGWGPFASSNEVWVLEVKSMSWRKQQISSPAPHPRYGHSQINIDENHLLIVGGCGGPNMLFSDIWLLKMSDEPDVVWEWKEIEILQKDNAAPQLTFHPACRVDSKVVVLSKAQWSRSFPSCLPQLLRTPTRTWVPPRGDVFARPEPLNRSSETELCVNGKKGVLKRHLQRTLARRSGNSNTSSSDDEELHVNVASKKGIIINSLRASPELDNLQPRATSTRAEPTTLDTLQQRTPGMRAESTAIDNLQPWTSSKRAEQGTPPAVSSQLQADNCKTVENKTLLRSSEQSCSQTPGSLLNGFDRPASPTTGMVQNPNLIESILDILPSPLLVETVLATASYSPGCEHQPNYSSQTVGESLNPISASPSSSSSSSISNLSHLSTASTSSNDSQPEKNTDRTLPSNIRPVLSVRPNARRNRQRQLEGLDRMEQRIRNLRAGVSGRALSSSKPLSNSTRSPSSVSPKNPMCLYVLDIDQVVEKGQVTWIAPQVSSSSGLEEIILYSLVLGRGELVMFGGIQKDMNSSVPEGEKAPQTVSNSLHFISAFKYII